MALAEFGELYKDLPAYANPGATVADGVLPKTPKSYGPLAALSAYSTNALTARAQGAYACLDSAATTHNFAGDATKLYKLASAAWTDVSGTTYTTPADGYWRFTQFGTDVYASNFSDYVQYYTLGTSSVFANLTAAPKCRDLTIIRDFMFTGNTYDTTDGAVPNRVWWSAIGDPTTWPTPGSASAQAVQSDYQDLPNGGWVQRVIGAVGGADGAVIMETSIYRISYDGVPAVFRFDEVERAVGTPAPGSVVNVGNVAFYLGTDGFRAFDGTQSVRIGENKIDQFFLNDVDTSLLFRVTAAVDPVRRVVYWSYCSSGNTTPDKLIMYHYGIGRWTTASVTMEIIWRSLAEGYTLDSLDNYNSSIDALPYSLDSRFWTGNNPNLAAFNSSHYMALFSGDNLAATMETGEFDGGMGRRVFISGLRPFVDGGVTSGAVTCAVGYRNTTDGTVTYTTATAAGDNGVCGQRISARFARGRISIASGTSWTHALGLEPTVRQEGKR